MHPTTSRLLCTLTVALLSAATAQGSLRTFVSGVGDDVNPCSRTAPCKTFAGAISKTDAGGEISVLDPGGYGTVTITKSITINGNGMLASILNSGGINGVTVNAGPDDTVILRNLSINGAGSTKGLNGIRYIAGATLTVEDCTIENLSSDGIEVAHGGNGSLQVINTVIEKAGGDGINFTTTSGIVVATIENTKIFNCDGDGIEAVTNARGTIMHSRIAFCDQSGIRTSGNNTQLNVVDSVFANCELHGLRAEAGSSIRVGDSMIVNNSTGLSTITGGTVISLQGNSLVGNSVQGAFTSTVSKF